LAINTTAKGNGNLLGAYIENGDFKALCINLHNIEEEPQPKHLMPGVVDDTSKEAVVAHELAHYALTMTDVSDRLELSFEQEEAICDAIATVFASLFREELRDLINQADYAYEKISETNRPVKNPGRKSKI
jgi:hypothetical protein